MVSPSEPVRVVLVDRGGSATGLYLSQALAIGDSPKFEYVTRQPENLSDDDLRRTSLVVLNDTPVSTPLARRLLKFVDQGGGMLVAAGAAPPGRATWTCCRPASATPWTGPGGSRRASVASSTATRCSRPSGRRAAATSWPSGSTAIATSARSPGAQVLARFDAGAPAVVERRVGAGRVLMWASTLDQVWTDLPIRPLFLPFIHRAATHLVAYVPSQPWSTVGQILDTSRAGAHKGQSVPTLVLTPRARGCPSAATAPR